MYWCFRHYSKVISKHYQENCLSLYFVLFQYIKSNWNNHMSIFLLLQRSNVGSNITYFYKTEKWGSYIRLPKELLPLFVETWASVGVCVRASPRVVCTTTTNHTGEYGRSPVTASHLSLPFNALQCVFPNPPGANKIVNW